MRFDVCKLRSEEIRSRNNIEVKNRFEALTDIEDPQEEHHKILVSAYRDAAKKSYLKVQKAEQAVDRRQNVGKIQERKEAKLEIEGA